MNEITLSDGILEEIVMLILWIYGCILLNDKGYNVLRTWNLIG